MRVLRYVLRVSAFFLSVLSFSIASFAQAGSAELSGRVTDPNGLAVAGARVTAVNQGTNGTYPTESNEAGLYNLPTLPPGIYRMTVEKEGFEQVVKPGLELHVADSLAINFTLTVGSLSQSVTVSGEAPLVNTTSGSLGGLVDDQRMADLPLNGRNYIDLSLMQAGINDQKNGVHQIGYVGTYVVSNGATVRSNNYLLDGANMTNAWGVSSASVTNSTLGVDGIKEYKVVTNAFSAEYGMSAGSQMLMLSKSGTNSYHGAAFEYLRNSAMDARNFFDSPASSGKSLSGAPRRLPIFQRNNFGADLGGPIKKDKVFFDAVYEALRSRQGLTQTTTGSLPASCLQTDSNWALLSPANCTKDANQSTPVPAGATVPVIERPLFALTQPFPSNILGGPTGKTPQFTYAFLQPSQEDYGQMRMDETLSSKDSLFERWTAEDSTQPIPGFFPGYYTSGADRTQFVTISEDHIFSPAVVNTFRAHFSRTSFYWAGVDPPEASGPGTACIPNFPTCGLGIQGFTEPSTGGRRRHKQNLLTQSDDLFYTRGRHSFKFGALFNEYLQVITNGGGCCGTQTFPTIAAFFSATPSIISVNQGPSFERTYKYKTYGFYGQDDWRLTSRLTLNLGLRYEFTSTPYEAHHEWSVIKDLANDQTYTVTPFVDINPSLRNFSPRIGFAWDVFGNGKMAVRGGIAPLFDIGGITAFLLQTQNSTPPYSNRLQILNPTVPSPTNPNPPPFTLPLVFPTSGPGAAGSLAPRPTDWNLKQTRIVLYNLTVERQLPLSIALTVAYAGSKGYNLANTQEGNPTIPQGVPGPGGTCVPRPTGQAVNTSSMIDGAATACWIGPYALKDSSGKLITDPRTNSNFGTMDLFTNRAHSWYNALQVGLVKRLSHGLQFQNSFTWSKSIDEQAGAAFAENTSSQAADGVDTFNINNERGPTVFDVPYSEKFNVIYQVPSVGSSSAFVQKLTSGWWLSSITTVQGGYPFSLGLNTERSGSGVQGGAAGVDRPDILPGRDPYNITHGVSSGCSGVPAGTLLGTPTLYYDPCAFAVPALGLLGNVGRNTLRGPNFRNLDFSIVKDTSLKYLGEGGKVEFRAEIFNILNHPNFSLPSRTAFNGNQGTKTPGSYTNVETPFTGAGTITTTVPAVNARQVQLALKILF